MKKCIKKIVFTAIVLFVGLVFSNVYADMKVAKYIYSGKTSWKYKGTSYKCSSGYTKYSDTSCAKYVDANEIQTCQSRLAGTDYKDFIYCSDKCYGPDNKGTILEKDVGKCIKWNLKDDGNYNYFARDRAKIYYCQDTVNDDNNIKEKSVVKSKTKACVTDTESFIKPTQGTPNSNNYQDSNQGRTIIDRIIYIGDERVKGIANVDTKNPLEYINKDGAGYEYLSNKDTKAKVDKRVKANSAVVIYLGVHDFTTNKSKTYYTYINEVAKEWTKKGAKVLFVSVNPVDETKATTIKNEKIKAFNLKMKQNLKGVTYVDTYSKIDWSKTKFSDDGITYQDKATNEAIETEINKLIYETKNIKNVKVTGVKINGTNKVQVGKKIQLTADITPSNASNKAVSWKSNKPGIAKVSESGKVTGVKTGTVVITATAKDGSKKSGTIKIKVVKASKSTKGKSDSKSGKKKGKDSSESKDDGKNVKVKSVKITGRNQVGKGSTITLSATISPKNATHKSVKWESSNPKIATVDSKGVLKGIKIGKTTITATAKDGSKKKGTLVVEVIKVTGGNSGSSEVKDGKSTGSQDGRDNKGKKVKVSKVTISGDKEVQVGKTSQLEAAITPSTANKKTVKWTSSDKKIATVSSTGKVKGIKIGKVKITATAEDGSRKKDTYTISVVKEKKNKTHGTGTATSSNNKIKVLSYYGQDIPAKIGVDESLRFFIHVYSDADQQYHVVTEESAIKYTVTSSDTKVIKVNNVNKLTALKAGKSTITIKLATGEVATFELTVINTPTFKIQSSNRGLTDPKCYVDVLTFEIKDTSNREIALIEYAASTTQATYERYSESKKKYITGEIEGKDVYAELASRNVSIKGNVAAIKVYNNHKYIKFKAHNKNGVSRIFGGNKEYITNIKKSCDKKDSGNGKPAQKGVKVTSVKIEGTDKIQVGTAMKLTVTVKPDNAEKKTVKWSSSDKTIASVDKTGKVTAHKKGIVTITATAEDGSKKKDDHKIEVVTTPVKPVPKKNIKVKNITITGDKDVQVGKTITLKVTVTPSDAKNKSVKWTTSDSKIATVSSKGVVKGIKAGKATITATAQDGSKVKGTYIINVTTKSNSTTKKDDKKVVSNPINVSGKYLDVGIDKEISFTTKYDDNWFTTSSSTENKNLARLSVLSSSSVYNVDYAKSLLEQCGFSDVTKIVNTPTKNNNDTVSYVLGNKKIGDNTLIAIIIKGTSGDYEWVSNFNIGEGATVHEGFKKARNIVSNGVKEYVKNIKGTKKIWITGHSRGAAVANLYAKDLNKSYGKANVYAYTFATPRVDMDGSNSSNFDNIHNYINPGDFITEVAPKDWGFNRYGKDISISATGIFTTIAGTSYDGLTKNENDSLVSSFVKYSGNNTKDYYTKKEKKTFLASTNTSPAYICMNGLALYLNKDSTIKAQGKEVLTEETKSNPTEFAPLATTFAQNTEKIVLAHCPTTYVSALLGKDSGTSITSVNDLNE